MYTNTQTSAFKEEITKKICIWNESEAREANSEYSCYAFLSCQGKKLKILNPQQGRTKLKIPGMDPAGICVQTGERHRKRDLRVCFLKPVAGAKSTRSLKESALRLSARPSTYVARRACSGTRGSVSKESTAA